MEIFNFIKKTDIKYIILAIVVLLCLCLGIILLFNQKVYYRIIYLDVCYRLAEGGVIISENNNVYYTTYKDCSQLPRKINIDNILFIEQ